MCVICTYILNNIFKIIKFFISDQTNNYLRIKCEKSDFWRTGWRMVLVKNPSPTRGPSPQRENGKRSKGRERGGGRGSRGNSPGDKTGSRGSSPGKSGGSDHAKGKGKSALLHSRGSEWVYLYTLPCLPAASVKSKRTRTANRSGSLRVWILYRVVSSFRHLAHYFRRFYAFSLRFFTVSLWISIITYVI